MMSKREEIALNMLPPKLGKTLVVSPQSPQFMQELQNRAKEIKVLDQKPPADIICDICAAHEQFQNAFNTLIMLDVLEHIHDQELAVRSIHQIVKRKGTIIISVPLYNKIYNLLDLQRHFRYHYRFVTNELVNLTNAFFMHIEHIKYGNIWNAIRNLLHVVTKQQFNFPQADQVPGDFGIVVRFENR